MRGVTDMYDAQAQQKGRQGRLKIFFGYAAGVGKTYAMLEAAHLAQKQGVDVVVGYIERHTRPDTLALLDGLEQLPTRTVEYRGIELREFDIDAALERRPQLILVDGAGAQQCWPAAGISNGIRMWKSCSMQASMSIPQSMCSIWSHCMIWSLRLRRFR